MANAALLTAEELDLRTSSAPADAELVSVTEAGRRIATGESLLISAEQQVLEQLPHGNWIGGTIPYFLTPTGGATDREQVFVQGMPRGTAGARFACLSAEELPEIANGVRGNEYIFVILPGLSDILMKYAAGWMDYPNLMDQPVMGWVSGVYLGEGGNEKPLVVDGRDGSFHDDRAVVAYVRLNPGVHASVSIVNIFEQASGDAFLFDEDGFSFSEVWVNGHRENFAEYLAKNEINTQLPLVADYAGTMVNTSFKAVDVENGVVELYAPVFSGFEYRLAAPVGDYGQELIQRLKHDIDGTPAISCTCILNYLYGGLEGKMVGSFTGPVTFGEIGYLLLNQTVAILELTED